MSLREKIEQSIERGKPKTSQGEINENSVSTPQLTDEKNCFTTQGNSPQIATTIV
jgi:hypothetical protein